MGFTRPENYRPPEFCAGCPPASGMESVEVRQTTNPSPDSDTFYEGGAFPEEPIIYACDPDHPEAGAIELGKYRTVDAFCQCHEFASSKALGDAHDRIERCAGPVTERKFFGLIKRERCGADFRNIGGTVVRLNRRSRGGEPRTIVDKALRSSAGAETR